jgi:hypothetical protein
MEFRPLGHGKSAASARLRSRPQSYQKRQNAAPSQSSVLARQGRNSEPVAAHSGRPASMLAKPSITARSSAVPVNGPQPRDLADHVLGLRARNDDRIHPHPEGWRAPRAR